MKIVLRGLAAVLLALPLLLLLATAAALQDEAAVTSSQDIAPADLARAVALLRANDPRRGEPGRAVAVQVTERDLEVLLDHGARRWTGAASRVSLQPGSATVRLSGRAPPNPFGDWVNVEVRLAQTASLPAVDALRIGRLPLPAGLGQWLARWAVERAGLLAELQLTADVVRSVRFAPRQMQLVYAWRDDSAQRVIEALVPAAEQQRLRAQAERLAELTQAAAPAWEVPLVRLLGPMFALAQQRSAAGGDAAAENRAAIVVLALYANGRGLHAVLPAARQWPRPRPLRLLLEGRDDFPRHFLVSAALVVESSGALAQAVGVAKEVADARGGSGFSFNDMAANLAGTRFGELSRSEPQALQQRLAAGVKDGDLMPPWADLPEFLPEPEFLRRYGGVGAPPYQALIAEIERRVGALPLLR